MPAMPHVSVQQSLCLRESKMTGVELWARTLTSSRHARADGVPASSTLAGNNHGLHRLESRRWVPFTLTACEILSNHKQISSAG